MEATFVIIGGGIAGVSCAEGIACLAPSERVILISSSPTVKAVTNIRPLAKLLTQFDVEERDSSALPKTCPNVNFVCDSVIGVDFDSCLVLTSSGSNFKFKKLCICTGASPKLITHSNPHVIGIRDTDSVEHFQKKLCGARTVLVVGNGGIASELVYEMSNVEVVWVIKDKHISAPFIDPGAAEFLWSKGNYKKQGETEKKRYVKRFQYTASGSGVALGPDWHRGINLKGRNSSCKIAIEFESHVVSISDGSDGWPVCVKLNNGKVFNCDFVVSATGVEPNSSIFKGLEKAADGGILVDWKMETNKPGVYAAGDVCTANWAHAPHWIQMRLWTQAHQMGTYVAKAMVGSIEDTPFLQDFCFELFTHMTHFFGQKVVLLGLFNGQKLGSEYEILLRVTPQEEYIKIIVQSGRLQGAILIGETDLEEMVENLILDQLDVTSLLNDLLNPDIDIEDYFD